MVDPTVWVTRDKRHIPIAELEDDHLVNVCTFLRRQIVPMYRLRAHQALLAMDFSIPRSDALEDAIAHDLVHMPDPREPPQPGEIAHAIKTYPVPGLIENLVAEVRKRGLESRLPEESFITDIPR